MSMPKHHQAKHLTDEQVCAAISSNTYRWSSLEEVRAEFPTIPPKVVLAKLRSLIRRGIITGCGCGCSGGFQVITKERKDAAAAFVARALGRQKRGAP